MATFSVTVHGHADGSELRRFRRTSKRVTSCGAVFQSALLSLRERLLFLAVLYFPIIFAAGTVKSCFFCVALVGALT